MSRRGFVPSRMALAWGRRSSRRRSTRGTARHRSTPRASPQVGPGRFVFIDNHDPSALFELALDSDGAEVERISRRPLAGLAEGELRDPEGLDPRRPRRRDPSHRRVLALCPDAKARSTTVVCDGLVRVRYTRHGDLHAEAMHGFRDWLLRLVPSLAAAGKREPDAGGLNVEGLAWDPHTRTLLFGLRGPADPGSVTVIRVPVDAGAVAPWTTESLGAPSDRARPATRIKRDAGHPRHLLRRADAATSCFCSGVRRAAATNRFSSARGTAAATTVQLLDVTFHRSMKPEGVVAFSDRRRKETPHRRRPRWLRGRRLPRGDQ